MKIYLKIVLLLVTVFFFSCSEDDSVDENESLYGTWENIKIEGGNTYTLNLVFGKELVGKTYKTEDTEERVVSNHAVLDWNIENNVIEIVNHNDTYTLNAVGQLISNESDGVVLDKISNDYPEDYDDIK